MKKLNNIIFGGLIISLASFTSCSDFLDVDPKTAIPEETVFSSLETIKPTIDGLYTSFREMTAGREGMIMTLLGLDESKQGWVQMDTEASQAGLDYYSSALNASSTQVDAMWSRRWPVVVAAAQAVNALDVYMENETDKAKLNEAERLRGEACFIRALVMMQLTMYWGEVPVIDIANMVNTARQPLNVVWKQIIDDMTYATEHLEDDYDDGQKFRATSGAAYFMLLKAYMSAPVESGFRNYENAKKAYESVPTGRYNLDKNFANLFAEDMEFNSPESVFEIDFENPYPLQNYWQFDLGSRTVDATWGNGCYFSGYDIVLPTEYAYKDKEEGGIWESGDQRKDVSIRYEFSDESLGYSPAPTAPSWGADELDPHIKKYEDKRTDVMNGNFGNMWNSGKNFIFLRYADVLLMYAECLNELGETGRANNIVNEVRARAWGGELPSEFSWNYGQEEFRKQILDERIRELCFEGWRRWDLIRTGKFVELIKERNPWTKQNGTIQKYHIRYPIPETEIKNNEDIEDSDQNEGY